MTSCYLITGGAGFIGSHLAQRLLQKRNKVVALDNMNNYYSVGLKQRNLDLLINTDGFTFVKGDIRNAKVIKTIFRDHSPDYVIHQAAQAGVRFSVRYPKRVMDTNIIGTLNLLEACREASVKKFVNASSSSVYGVVKYLPFDEEHPKSPISPYGVSKLAAEHYVRVFDEIYGIKGVSLRYFTVFGPRMRPDLAINIFTRAALSERPIEIFGSGRKTRDFTYIDNIVKATLLALRKGRGEYNIGSGTRISIQKLAQKIVKLADSDSDITYSCDAEGDMQHTQASIKKAQKELGYEVKIDLLEGLKRYVEWVEESEG
jgi:UDP-glucose 4-epimerase